jgi:hypothetical protein
MLDPDMAGSGLHIAETVTFGCPCRQTGGHRKCEGHD